MYISESQSANYSNDVYDCVIIGSGIVGLYLASCSAFKNLKIAVIPGGPAKERDSNLSQSGISNEKISEQFHNSRPWVLGGSSGIWGGRFREFDQWDVEGRSHLGLNPWPIDWKTMLTLYENVFLELGLNDVKECLDLPELGEQSTHLDFTGREFWLNSKNFLSIADSKIRVNQNIRIFENFAYLKTLRMNPSNASFQILCVDQKGSTLELKSLNIVFASGAVENSRHLLNFQSAHQSTLGSVNKLLGKNLMVHLLTKFPHIKQPSQVSFEFERMQKLNYKRTIQLRSDIQVRYGLANSLGTFSPIEANLLNLLDLTNSGARILKRYGRDFPKELYLRRKDLKRILKHQVVSRNQNVSRNLEDKGNAILSIWGEQLPSLSNEVTISPQKDPHGINKANVQVSLGEFELHSLALSASLFELFLGNSGESDPGVFYKRNRELVEESLQDGPLWGHQIGGTQMGVSNKDGVVNIYGESFDYPGVFVCGTSVFPSGSHAAPTLTALALAQNTALKIRQRITNS